MSIENISETDKEVLIAFAENDMNVSKTTRSKYMHRNTVIYHLNKIQIKTGINPFKFLDLVKLLRMCNYEGIKEKER